MAFKRLGLAVMVAWPLIVASHALADITIAASNGNETSVGLMSGGQRQAVVVACAAAFATKLETLDEPTATLGVRERRRARALLSFDTITATP
jgi:fructose transport system ATP-binding protein